MNHVRSRGAHLGQVAEDGWHTELSGRLGGAGGIPIGDAYDIYERQVAQRAQMVIGNVTGAYGRCPNPPARLIGIGPSSVRFQPAGLNLFGMNLVRWNHGGNSRITTGVGPKTRKEGAGNAVFSVSAACIS